MRGHWTLTLQTVMLHSGGSRLRTSMNNQEYIPVRLSKYRQQYRNVVCGIDIETEKIPISRVPRL